MSACRQPIPATTLIAYLLGELSAVETDEVEEHYFNCSECSAEMAWLTSTAVGTRELVSCGLLSTCATVALLERAEREGARARTYRSRPGERVECTITAEDTFVVSRFAAELAASERVDLELHIATAAGDSQTCYEDVPVDRERGEVVCIWAAQFVRSFPEATLRWRLRSRGRGGALLGEYLYHHTPPADG